MLLRANPLPAVVLWLTASCVVLASSHSAQAQSIDEKRAVLAFDIRVDQLANAFPDQKRLLSAFGPGKIHRIYGAISAPPSISAFQRMQDKSDPLECEGFLRLEFASEEAATKASARKDNDGLQAVTIDGDEFYQPQENNASFPSNLLMRRVSPTAIEFGTLAYLKRSNPNVFTKNLYETWAKSPQGDIRLAIDLGSSQHLIDEAIRSAKGGLPLPAQPLVVIAQTTSVLYLRIDFNDPELMRLTATTIDEASAKQVHMILSGMLEIIKNGVRQSLDWRDEDVRNIRRRVLDSLTSSIDGKNTHVIVPRPDGGNKAIASLLGSFKVPGVRPELELLPGLGPRPNATPREQEAFNQGLLEGFLDAQ